MRSLSRVLGAALVALLASTAACSSETTENPDGVGDEDDLTSITARSRKLEFVGTVYVEPSAGPDAILAAVRAQACSAGSRS